MIDAKALSKHYGRKLAVDQLSFNVRGRGDRFPRPKRIGKVDHDAHDHGPGRTQCRRRHREWPALPRPPMASARGRRALGGEGDPSWPECSSPSSNARGNEPHPASADRRSARDRWAYLRRGPARRANSPLGMGQRLGIAAALLGDPGVMLFDEPVNGLDPDGIRWVRNLLKGFAREGRTVFVSSHLMSEMALTADEVVIIGKGRLISPGHGRRVTRPELAAIRAGALARSREAAISPRVRGRDHRARRRRFDQRSRQGRG